MTATAFVQPEVIPQRDLRNSVGEVLRRANAGQEFVVTTNGEPMARVMPLTPRAPSLDRVPSHPAKRQGGFTLPLYSGGISVQQFLDENREDRL
ncbi:MAG: type II toxin-antitoxin system prevent-host-death family antitoxin [Promicromonosporaceae bacterium]|nr:type II toxin-antitoxin system prevent-host-death family antitoxin [Promicromonosporaceae bacterium]